GTPVVMRETSIPAARSSCAKASRNSFASPCRRASVISQRMRGWVSSLAAEFNTPRLILAVDAALERSAGGIAMFRRDVGCDQPERGRQHRGIVGEAEHWQHVRNEIERQDEIGDGPKQRRL